MQEQIRQIVATKGRLVLLDRATGKTTPVLASDAVAGAHFALSRDEAWLYLSIFSDESDVWLAEMR